VKWPLQFPDHHSIRLLAFSLHVLDKSLLLVVCASDIFSYSVASLFSFLMVVLLFYFMNKGS